MRSDQQEYMFNNFMRKVKGLDEQLVVIELGINRKLAVWRFLEEKLFQFKNVSFIRVKAT